ncbi:hypothetical protein LTR27_012976 [Elasticomyces elasticus]|nr:hypothetical protein LTR27_012976 [Elasticomyces elasticus]
MAAMARIPLPTNFNALPSPQIPGYYAQDQSRRDWHTIVQCILLSDTSAESVADSLASDVNTGNLDLTGNNALHPAKRTSQIFATIVDIAIHIPFNHVAQYRLLGLMQALRRQSGPPEAIREAIREIDGSVGEFFWADLPTFSFLIHDLFDYMIPLQSEATRMAGHGWSGQEWLNYNAFLSLLLAEGVAGQCDPDLGFDHLALRLLHLTLEIPQTNQDLESNIPAAVVWILNAGKWIHAHDGLLIDPRVQKRKDKLYNGQDGFCVERWSFWKRRFEEIAQDDGLLSETKNWALQAGEYMESLG